MVFSVRHAMKIQEQQKEHTRDFIISNIHYGKMIESVLKHDFSDGLKRLSGELKINSSKKTNTIDSD